MRRWLPVALALGFVAAGCGSSPETDGVEAGAPTTTSTTVATTTTTAPPIEIADVVTVIGNPLPRFGQTPDPAVGLTAPTLAGTSFDGSPVRIEPHSGFTVVIFFAHWCPHCQAELAELGPYLKSTPPPDGINLVAVSTGADERRPNFPPSQWLTPDAWALPVLVDSAEDEAANAYGLNAYPFWVVLDSDGVVLARTAGSLPPESVETLFHNLSQREVDP